LSLSQRTLFDDFGTADPCARRHGGNAESVAAHESIKPTKAQQRQAVYDVIHAKGIRGATLDEVCIALGRPANALSGRVTELVAAGSVRRTTRKRMTRAGRPAAVLVSVGR
jgi:hypothetical protein